MTTDQRYEAKQRIHWVVKPLLISLAYMTRAFGDCIEPKTEYSKRLFCAMEKTRLRIVGNNEANHWNDVFASASSMMIALSESERELFPLWLNYFIEELGKENLI